MKRYIAAGLFVLGAALLALSINYSEPRPFDLFRAFTVGFNVQLAFWLVFR